MSNIQVTGYVAMALNFAVVFIWLVVIFRSEGFLNAFNSPPLLSEFLRAILPTKISKNKNFRKIVLTSGVIFKFLMTLLDSFFGEIQKIKIHINSNL